MLLIIKEIWFVLIRSENSFVNAPPWLCINHWNTDTLILLALAGRDLNNLNHFPWARQEHSYLAIGRTMQPILQFAERMCGLCPSVEWQCCNFEGTECNAEYIVTSDAALALPFYSPVRLSPAVGVTSGAHYRMSTGHSSPPKLQSRNAAHTTVHSFFAYVRAMP